MERTDNTKTSGLLAAEPALVRVRHPAKASTFWGLALLYGAIIALLSPVMAVVALLFLPVGAHLAHPRRALWLWAMGMGASVGAIFGLWNFLGKAGGFTSVWVANPALAVGAVLAMLLAAVAAFWHLSWVSREG